MVADGQFDPLRIPVQAYLQILGTGIGGVVQQIEQRLTEVRRRHQLRRTAKADALEAECRLRAHQVPALQDRVDPFARGLLDDRLAPVSLGSADQLSQTLLAELDLRLQQAEILAQLRVLVFLTQLLEQHAHGRQWRAQFMSGASGLGGHGEQLLVTHALLAALGLLLLLPAQLFGHARDEEGDQRGRQRETQPHAVNLQRRAFEGWQGERVVPDQHQRVTQQRQAGKHDGIQPRQGCRRDGQRHQIVGHERIGRTAGVVQQRAMDHQVAAQVHGVFELGNGPWAAQTQCRAQTEHRRHGQCDPQREPRQRQQLGRIGHAHGAGLRSQHHDANKGQKPKVLPAGR